MVLPDLYHIVPERDRPAAPVRVIGRQSAQGDGGVTAFSS